MGDVFNARSKSSRAGNEIEATYHGGVVNVSVSNPWAGDTETGFGYTTYVDLDRDTARLFAQWLLDVTSDE